MEKTLIIITREYNEFDCYWDGDINNKLNGSNILVPIKITLGSSKVIIISPYSFNVTHSSVNFGERIKAVLEASDIKLKSESIGILVHGSDNFNIENAGLNNISFRKKYSSTKGADFCEIQNDNFIANTDKNIFRSGVLDAFRDAYIFKRSEQINDAFNNLWNYFLVNSDLLKTLHILHQCLVPEKAKNMTGLPQELESDYNTFKDKIKKLNTAFDTGYQEALRQLRDKWLFYV